MVSITQINLNWGSYYDSHDVGTNGTVTIITSNVTDGTTVNVGLNSIIYTGTVNNNSAFVNIPSTAFNILTSKVEYVVTGSINNIAQAFATFVYDPTKDPFVLNPNSPTVIWPNNITNDGTVTVTLGGGASTWEYSLDYGNNWTSGTNNSFVLNDGTYPITSIHVRNSSSSGVVSTSKINEYEIIISSTPPNPPTVTWPNSPSNDGIVNVTLDVSASTWQYSLNNGVNWNDGSGTTFTLSEGLFNANFLQVRNIDIAGNISSVVTNPTNIIVDKTDPGIPTVIWPNGFSADGTVNITLGNDAVSWEYSLNNGVNWNDGNESSFILPEGSYSKYILQVRNSDSAGNISSVVFNDYDITIDNTPPNPPTVIWPSITNTGIINVTIDVSAATWEYSITSGSNWITGNGNSFTLSETTHLTNSIQVRNYNSLGVVSSVISNPDQIIVDRTIPSVPTVSWPNILSNNDVVNITLGNDATSWEYSLNNGVNWNDGIGTSFILPEGTYLKHTLQVRNSDDASNVSFTVVNLDNITIDKTIPIITISGESIVQHEKGTIYVDVGATAIDFSGIDLTENIIVNNEVNFNAVGTYSVTYDVSDDASNQAIQVIRTVNVVDTTLPIITISGESIVQHEKGTIYVDAGSVATDLSGIDLTTSIVTANNVDINTIGSYSVTYDVSDNVGNQASQVTRTVNVVDTTAPIITISGESIVQHEKGTIYVDAGSVATDLSGILLTNFIVTENNVDINTVGNYSVTYDVSDNVGNQAIQVTRTVNIVDTTAPIITLIGDASLNHEKGTIYVDPGVTATDLSNIDLTTFIVTVNNVDINTVGSYIVTYDVSDNVGNQAIQVIRTVNVVDTTIPIITISGESIVQHEKDTIYVDAGASATDLSNIDLTANIITSSNLNSNIIGSYTITYDVSDNVGNFAIQKSRTVNVVDTTAPVITIDGSDIVIHEKGTVYNDAGATAIDFSGIDLTSNIIITSNLNTNVVGTYTITYDVSDITNNFAIQKSRTVNVVDTTAPIITVDGSAIVIHEKGTIFNDPGVSATDLSGDDLTANIITSSNLNTNIVGTYTITYDVSDNANNFAIQKSRTVNVVDTTAPIITLIGNNNINHERGTIYNDLGAIATDLSGIDLTSNIIVNNGVLHNIVDMYQVTYDVSDNFGNQAIQVIRNVNVIDTTAPIITLNGSAIVTHEKGTIYNDLGAIATDLSNIDLTSIIVTNNNVDQDNVGTYSVTYNVSDNSGNQASQVTRTVNVIDTTSPVITLIGNSTVIHEMNAIYNDLGATAVDSPGIDLTSNIIVNNEVNINVEGSYNVYYDVSDNSGNQAIQVIRTVNVVDTTIPIIVLIGNSVINHERGTIYNDLGAVASDVSSNDLTSKIIVNNEVSFNIVGTYNVTYDVSDNAGNHAIQVIRTVNVIDTTAPVISLIGDASLNHEKGTTYIDAGASAIDLSNIDLTSSIITVNNVDINTVGSYTVTYDVSDNSGNQAIQIIRIVNVIDTTSPNSPFVIWPNSPANNGTVDVSMIDDAVRWEYSLNSGINWNDGSGTSFILAEGIYDASSLQVRSSDDASNISQIIANPNQIIIDLTVPSPPVVIWPTGLSNNNITITIDASASTWEYSIDNGVTWNNGTDNSFNLLDGSYGIGVIQVRNTDSANNISAISSNPSEIIISTIVNEPIVNWPNNPSRDGKVIITLGSGATTWEYSIDNSANWNDGSNNYFTLVDGSYGIGILQVRNSNSFGNVSNTVTNPYEIIVDSVVSAPFVTWPSSPSDDGIVTVLMSNDAVTWEYRLNSSSEWIDGCGNTFVLPEGTYQECIIQVRNSDVSGNISAITINPTEIIVDYTPATDSSNNVEFTLSAMNGSLDTSQFNTDDLDIEDMSKYVHVINVDMSLNKWNDLFFISPQGPAYLDNLSTLSSIDLFLNETIKFMTKSSNFTDAINDISINNLILDTGTLTADTKLYNITESCIKVWSKNIFGGIEYMDDIWSNRSIVVFEINDFLSNLDSSNSLVGKLKMTIDNANGKTNQNKTKINLTRQLMLQLHNSIYGRESFYRLTNTNGGIFSQTPVDISGNTWVTGAGDKYYPFKFISGDKLNFGLTIKHPDVYIPILGNSFDSQSPPNINIKVRVNMK